MGWSESSNTLRCPTLQALLIIACLTSAIPVAQSEPLSDSVYTNKAISSILSKDRFRYHHGYWYLLSPSSDSISKARIEIRFSDFLDSTLGCESNFDSKERCYCAHFIDIFESDYLNSNWVLFSAGRCGLELVGSTPLNILCGLQYSKFKAQKCVPNLYEFSNGRQANLTVSAKVAERDFNSVTFESEQLLLAAKDLVTVANGDYPTYIINGIDEVYHFSNVVLQSSFWDSVSTSVSLRRALTKVVLDTLDCIVSRFDIEGDLYYSIEEFAEFSDVVTSPQILMYPEHGAIVELWTWSPDSGFLVRWNVQFPSQNQVRINYEIVAEYLGYMFMRL